MFINRKFYKIFILTKSIWKKHKQKDKKGKVKNVAEKEGKSWWTQKSRIKKKSKWNWNK